MAHGLRTAAGLGVGPDCRIPDYSRTWGDLYQARPLPPSSSSALQPLIEHVRGGGSDDWRLTFPRRCSVRS
eukprot:71243-Alexandrium_andersonii.AAC.1